MAIWRVIASPLTILTHPNADKMALGKLGQFQPLIVKIINPKYKESGEEFS